jgi:hypothetical protein
MNWLFVLAAALAVVAALAFVSVATSGVQQASPISELRPSNR